MLGGLGHGARSLAGGEDDQAAPRRGRRQMRRQAGSGMRCGDRNLEQAEQTGAHGAWRVVSIHS